MERHDDIYDSITAGAIRMARRRWYVIALVALIGLGAGLALQALAPAVTGNQTVRFAPIPEERRSDDESTRTTQTDAALLAKRLEVAVENLELPDGTDLTALGEADTAVLTVTATGPDITSVENALATASALSDELAVAEATATYASDIEVLERSLETTRQRVAAAEQALADGRAQQLDPSTLNLLVSEQIETVARQAQLELDLATAQARLDLIDATLVSIDEPTIASEGLSPLEPVLFAVLGALVAFGCMVALQAVDGRIRRRIQIERDLPTATVLGTLPRDPGRDSLAEFSLGTSRLTAEEGIERLLIVPLSDSGQISVIEDLVSVPSETTAQPALADGFGTAGVGVLYVVPFGKVTLDELRAVAAAALAAGVEHVLVALCDVPEPDLAWAATSSEV